MRRLALKRCRHACRTATLAGLTISFPSASTFAADATRGDEWFSYSIPAEVQNDWNYRSEDAGNRHNNLVLKLEPEVTLRAPPVPGLSLHAHGVLEQGRDPDPGEDRIFEDEGFFIEDLFLRFETGPVAFRAGKTNPGFGIAWDKAPGIYGRDMAEDYELTERIALLATITAEAGELGRIAVTGGTFFLDTSPLQHSLFGDSRGTLEREDGGAGNTGDFSSFNLLVDGEGFAGIQELFYHFGIVRQAHGVDGTADETGLVAALGVNIDIGKGLVLSPLFEAVRFDNFDGDPTTERVYLSPSVQLSWQSWNLALAYTRRTTEQDGGERATDALFQVSAGYIFAFGLTADIGWKRLHEDGISTDTVGVLFTYAFGS